MSLEGFLLLHRETSKGVDECQLQEDSGMCEVLASLKYLKANFRRHKKAEEHLFQALAICQRTGEKQQASPLDLVATFGEACRIRKMTGGGSKSLRDTLSGCIADFNKHAVAKAACLQHLHSVGGFYQDFWALCKFMTTHKKMVLSFNS